jgi:hypothetical protein
MNALASGSGDPRRDCFVGCRFDGQQQRLKELLDSLLGYYGYRASLLDTAFGKRQILEEVFDRLKSPDVDFALFDNRATENRPNVYIELGIAFALGKPFILFQHQRTVIPADLAGFSTLRYANYKDLSWQLAVQLPKFLKDQT